MLEKRKSDDFKRRLFFERKAAAHPVRRNPLFPRAQGLLGRPACEAARLRIQYGGNLYPWNLHEPQEGVFEWEDERDFAAFALLAQRLGLHVILWPSPYICAEWEMGGVPWWLLKKPGLRLRCMNRPYPIPGRRLLCTLVLPEGDPMGDSGFAMRNFSTYSEICINYATPSVKEATLRVCNVALSM